MPIPLAVLNNDGIREFRDYLDFLRKNPKLPSPFDKLNNERYADAFEPVIQIEPGEVAGTAMQALSSLHGALAGIDEDAVLDNVGLWAWLSLLLFDALCPPGKDGNRKLGKDYRYIPDPSFKHRHRHLLAGPYRTYCRHGEGAALLLSSPLHKENSFHSELASRQTFISNDGIVEAAGMLYYDKSKGRPKAGALAHKKPGTLYRFIKVMQQLDLTYDLYSLSGERIIEILPAEFTQWKE